MRKKGKSSRQHSKRTCKDCTFEHDKDSRCPASRKECRRCRKEGHFSRSSNCKGKDGTANRVQQEEDYTEANYSSDKDETVSRVVPDRSWPGVRKGAGRSRLHRVEWVAKVSERRRGDRMVKVRIGGQLLSLFMKTGC